MSFANKVYRDGEWTYDTPEWKKRLEELELDQKPNDFNQSSKRFGANEIGLTHPTNGAYIRITEDGNIELFSSYGTGLKIGKDNSIQIFADKVQQIVKENKVQTSANNITNQKYYESYPEDKGFSLDTIERLSDKGINTYNSQEWK